MQKKYLGIKTSYHRSSQHREIENQLATLPQFAFHADITVQILYQEFGDHQTQTQPGLTGLDEHNNISTNMRTTNFIE